METRCLSLHASYACQHRGECCRTWQVPAEPHVLAFVRQRGRNLDEQRVLVAYGNDENQRHIAHAGGVCVFRSHDRCVIHEEAGETALPVSCRHFPRVILRDPRGALIALSHYCPTAAALLFDPDARPRIVRAPEPLALQEPIEGLDARDVLPPLLRPGMLTDIEGYAAWERSAIDVLATEVDVRRALDIIDRATEEVRRWSPELGPLKRLVHKAFASARAEPAERCRTPSELDIVRKLYRGTLRLPAASGLQSAWDKALPAGGLDLQRPIANYLASRLFGNWVAYQGHGLRSVVAWVRACYDVLRGIATADRPASAAPLSTVELMEAIRLTDLIMLHTIDSHAFARDAAGCERAPAA